MLGHKAEKWRRVRIVPSKSAFDRAAVTDSKIRIGATEPMLEDAAASLGSTRTRPRHRAALHTAVAKGAQNRA
jgi:hypothetical protein